MASMLSRLTDVGPLARVLWGALCWGVALVLSACGGGGDSPAAVPGEAALALGAGPSAAPAALSPVRVSFVSPQPTGLGLLDAAWTGPDTVVAVGQGGAVLRSEDAGQTWRHAAVAQLVSTTMLTGVAFQGLQGIAVGSGYYRISADGGANWTALLPMQPQFPSVGHVAFAGTHTAVAVGEEGRIVRTTDAGWHWKPVSYSGPQASLQSVAFNALNIGLAVGSQGTVLRSTNGGQHWSVVSSGTTQALSEVAFASDSVAVAVGGDGLILRSTDGGRHWSKVASGTTQWLSSVHFSDSGLGLALDNLGTVLRSTNQGKTWKTAAPGESSRFAYRLRLAPASSNAVVVGGTGLVRRSADAGASWQSVPSAGTLDLKGIAFASHSTGAAVGLAGTILHTSDGGESWTPAASNSYAQLQAVAFGNSKTGVAVGIDGVIVRTINGGATWKQVAGGTSQFLTGVAYASPSVAVVTTTWGGLLRSTDGGRTWQRLSVAPRQGYSAVAFGSEHVGVVVGHNGTILRTTDGGATWAQVPSGTTTSLFNVTFADADTAVAVGYGGQIVRSHDGGQTWSVATEFSSDSWLLGVAFRYGHGLVVGDQSFLARIATVASEDWRILSWCRNEELSAVAIASPRKAFAVGSRGTIIKVQY